MGTQVLGTVNWYRVDPIVDIASKLEVPRSPPSPPPPPMGHSKRIPKVLVLTDLQ